MRGGTGLRLALWVACAALALPARADDNDLSLERLIGRPSAPGMSPPITLSTRSAYAGLVSELGVALAPRPLQPADSLGWSGFAVAVDTAFTQVNRSADYWQLGARSLSSLFLPTIGATVRKGIWLPFPSFELSAGGHKLLGSGIYTLELAAKLALHEGFHRWPIPSIALRVAVAHLLGSTQIGMTVLDAGVLVSKRFAMGGGIQLDPYIGAGAIVAFVQSRLIDTTPDIDALRQPSDEAATVRLPDPGALPRVRVHGGLRVRASLFQLTAEVAYALCNTTGRDCGVASATQLVDRSGGQLQVSLAIGMVY